MALKSFDATAMGKMSKSWLLNLIAAEVGGGKFMKYFKLHFSWENFCNEDKCGNFKILSRKKEKFIIMKKILR